MLFPLSILYNFTNQLFVFSGFVHMWLMNFPFLPIEQKRELINWKQMEFCCFTFRDLKKMYYTCIYLHID